MAKPYATTEIPNLVLKRRRNIDTYCYITPDSGVDIEYSKVMNEGDVMHFIGLNDSINRFKYKAVSGRKAK